MNPWHKRANEFIRDADELLPLISPQPIKNFFQRESTRLFDRLVVVVGSPGSGKTTLARLLELRTLAAVPDFKGNTDVRELLASLAQADVLDDLEPAVIALRLPAGGQLRSIWDLPYEDRLRHRLLRAMIEAKTVLGWLRAMEDVGVDLQDVRIITTPNAEAARDVVNADDLVEFRNRARMTERAIFKLINALVAPREDELGEYLIDVDAPFAIIEWIEISAAWHGRALRLKPMVIIDDAHELHPTQLEDVDLWLRDREIKIARWMLTRIDSLNLEDFRRVQSNEETVSPGTNPGRDRVRILLQDTDFRNRLAFRSIAEDVARRYLHPLAAFHRRGSTLNLKTLLNTARLPVLSNTDLHTIQSENARLVEENQLTSEKVKAMEAAYPADLTPDVKAAVTHILLERELKRTPQRSLFGALAEDSAEEEVVSKVQRSVITGAELQMLHRFDRPFYFGFERLADAANENIEQFVTLASVLVDRLETQAIRGRPLALDARQQHKALREQAVNLIHQWDFPYAPQVRKLVDFIGGRCLELTLRPNAPLSDGANAYGVLRSDLANLDSNAELARVLHYALAYQALVLVEPYECKGKTWALFELGGVAIIAKGLTHSHGGFVEGTLHQLKTAVGSAA